MNRFLITSNKMLLQIFLSLSIILFLTGFETEGSTQALNKTTHKTKVIYLTFDDGPSPEAGKLLDILNKYNAKATFFMLGPNMEKNPDVVKRMVEGDFGIGLHGMTHDVHQIYRSKTAPVIEMTEAQQILNDISDKQSTLVRLPYGSIPYLTEEMRFLLGQKNFEIWDWNVDSEDWEMEEGSFVEQTIDSIEELENAGKTPVVLMHDKPETIQQLPELLSYLQQQGYEAKSLTNELTPLTFKCQGRCRSLDI